ncbi:MAG: Clp protease N-terminal domain-containing protein [Bacteroidales bacterium]|nr:Clp protease N-terminal domain-containing protein [Bacteroidales bacterium]
MPPFSEEWEILLAYARDEAMRTGWLNIAPDHLMLAILRHRDNAACRLLVSSGIAPDACKDALDEAVFSPEPVPYAMRDSIFPNARTLAVLNIALLEASQCPALPPCALHLLAALLRTGNSRACAYLREHRLTLSAIRSLYPKTNGPETPVPDPKEIAEILAEQIRKTFPAAPAPDSFIS